MAVTLYTGSFFRGDAFGSHDSVRDLSEESDGHYDNATSSVVVTGQAAVFY
jgi:hypothetical protein